MAAPAADEVAVDENTKLSDLTDRQILELTQSIKDKDARERPLVGSIEPIAELESEYQDGATIFGSKIKWLSSKSWTQIRRLRGDGNCFYRAFAFGFCERILVDLSPAATAEATLNKLESLLPLLEQVGFERAIFEDFYDPLKEILKSAAQGALPIDALLAAFNSTETSASIVVFLRLLTSAFLRTHEDDFAPYLFALEDDVDRFPTGAPSLHEYCQFYVEAVDRDADHLVITALTRCLDTSLSVAYLDLSATKEQDGHSMVDFHRFETEGRSAGPAEVWEGVSLLYRPGHYDLIYMGQS